MKIKYGSLILSIHKKELPENRIRIGWSSVVVRDPKYILEQSFNAEKKLSQFIEEIKKEYSIEPNKLYYSIETPTIEKYKFPLSGITDV